MSGDQVGVILWIAGFLCVLIGWILIYFRLRDVDENVKRIIQAMREDRAVEGRDKDSQESAVEAPGGGSDNQQ